MFIPPEQTLAFPYLPVLRREPGKLCEKITTSRKSEEEARGHCCTAAERNTHTPGCMSGSLCLVLPIRPRGHADS